jgi:CDP-L-myo-inositol myo-inositolphosphotransferase
MLGMQVGLRALLSAADVGATRVEMEDWSTGVELARDARVRVSCAPLSHAAGESLVIDAGVLLAPALLAELAPGEAIADADGVRVAARVLLSAGESPRAALAAATPRAFQADRYRYAVRCHDDTAVRAAERALLASLTKPSDGPVSRYLNRPISTAISRRLVPLGVSADQMTLVSGLTATAAAFHAAGESFAGHVIGAVLYQLHSILDGCDGEIARLTRRSTARGALLDSLVDDASNLLFFGALSVGVAASTHEDWPLAAGAIAVLGYLGAIAVQYAAVLRLTGSGDKVLFWSAQAGAARKTPRLLHELLRRNVFIALILVAVALGHAADVVAVLPVAAIGALTATLQRVRKTPAPAGARERAPG